MKMLIRPDPGSGLPAGLYNVGMRSLSALATPITRRRLAALLSATPLLAQTTPPPVTQKTPPLGTPAAAASAATPDEKLKKKNDEMHQMSARLTNIEVSMDTEPAFVFKP
ncbi:MAG TPA: hypothetical protein VLT36_25975 [Candidatus Dormibacteraeota bacterium]|nr:hypothetical protein [Candidatus Dormibacteraeota bacterium]